MSCSITLSEAEAGMAGLVPWILLLALLEDWGDICFLLVLSSSPRHFKDNQEQSSYVIQFSQNSQKHTIRANGLVDVESSPPGVL